MKSPRFLNTIGLVLGMVGVVLIFIWGPPQPDFQEYVGLAIEPAGTLANGTKIADLIRETRNERQRYTFISRTGLALIFAGFAIQIVAVWVP